MKVSVLSRGWATVQSGLLVLGTCALLWASAPSLAQTGALFYSKATAGNSATNALLSSQVQALTAERDSFKSRLGAARARIDALLDRLPGQPDSDAVAPSPSPKPDDTP